MVEENKDRDAKRSPRSGSGAPRQGDAPRSSADGRQGERKPYAKRDGEKKSYPPRDGERKSYPPRDGERKSYPPRDGERKSYPPRDGERKSYPPRDGERKSYPPRDGERKSYPPRDGERKSYPPRDGERKSYPPRDGERKSYPPRDGERKSYPPRDGDRKPYPARDAGGRKPYPQRGGSDRPARDPREDEIRSVRPRHDDPFIPEDVTPQDLHPSARNELKTLSKENAEMVARHMAMASTLIDEDPELAHQHALSAARRAGRIAVVRETLAITAYATGDYALALRELRTYRRISGKDDQIALMVDSERGVGRPDRALEVGRAVDRAKLDTAVRVELAIAMSGARLDLGQPERSLHELDIPELNPDRAFEWSPALFAARATVLEELGREDEAAEWRRRAEIAAQALGGSDDLQGADEFVLVEEVLEESIDEEFVPEDDGTASPAVAGDDLAADVVADADADAEATGVGVVDDADEDELESPDPSVEEANDETNAAALAPAALSPESPDRPAPIDHEAGDRA